MSNFTDEPSRPHETGIKAFLDSGDPLSEEAIEAVLQHAEEDLLVDYKESFDPKSDKCWVDIAIDAVAFSNTYGGYLVFGVQDKTYKKIGLSVEAQVALSDIKVVNEKLSRNVRPQFRTIRSAAISVEQLNFAIIFIPASPDRTHIFEEDMNVVMPSKQKVCLARKGAIYVRKSGSIQIMTSDDFEELLSRRTNRIRDKIFEGITKVIKAEPEHEVLVVAPDESSGQEKSFRVVDAPDAIAVKGLNLVATPSTPEGRIALWQMAHEIRGKDLPHREALMEIYAVRESLKLSQEQVAWLAEVSLIREVPCFYWLSRCDETKAKETILRAFDSAKRIEKFYILKVAAFYGKSFYNRLRESKPGSTVRDQTRYPSRVEDTFNTGKLTDRGSFEDLQRLAKNLAKESREQELTEVRKLDCALYAPF